MENPELIYQIGTRKVPRAGGHVLDFFEDKTVYNVADLRIVGDVMIGRMKIEDRLYGWLPFVWFYKTGEVKLLTIVEGYVISNSIYVGLVDNGRVNCRVKFTHTGERWHYLDWNFVTGEVEYYPFDI